MFLVQDPRNLETLVSIMQFNVYISYDVMALSAWRQSAHSDGNMAQFEGIMTSAGCEVPQFDGFVVRTGNDETVVKL